MKANGFSGLLFFPRIQFGSVVTRRESLRRCDNNEFPVVTVHTDQALS